MSLMVVVEGRDHVGAIPAVALEATDIEENADVGRVMPKEFGHELASWPAAHISAVLLTQPLDTAHMMEISRWEHASAVGHDVNITTRCPRD